MKKKVKVIKVLDDVFGGHHPNNINEGYTKEGYILKDPTVGESLIIYNKNGIRIFYTSGVKNVVNEYLFETENSTYQIEPVEE